MTIDEIKSNLRERLSAKRYIHSLGVAETAYKMALKYGASPEKAYLAGLIHDSAKELSLKEMHKIVETANLSLDSEMMASKALLHGPVGSILAETLYGISDKEIKEAIFYHTTGCPNMPLLDKIIFLADYIEPSRDFPGVASLRKLSDKDLDDALLAAYDSTIVHLIEQQQYIYELTFQGRNSLIKGK